MVDPHSSLTTVTSHSPEPIAKNSCRSQLPGWSKLDFAEKKRDKCKTVLLRLSLAGNLEKPLLSFCRAEWRERGYGL
jgi:hypothetical protein